MNRIYKYLFVLTLMIMLLPHELSASISSYYVRAKVLSYEILEPLQDAAVQRLRLVIETGQYKGSIVSADNYLWREKGYNTVAEIGDKLVLKVVKDSQGLFGSYVMSYYRSPYLYLACFLFIFAFVFITGLRRLPALLSIALNVALIAFSVFLIIRGNNPFIVIIICSFISCIATVYMIMGFGRASLSAAIASFAGLGFAGYITLLILDMMRIDGRFSMDARILQLASRTFSGWNIVDFKSLAAAAVMVACLGAVMDIAVSVSSAMWEIFVKAGNISRERLFKSGMSIGRDIIGTMLNSLLLVFLAVFMPLLILFEALGIPFIKLVNFEFVTIIIVSALAANITLIMTVPVTALISSLLFYSE